MIKFTKFINLINFKTLKSLKSLAFKLSNFFISGFSIVKLKLLVLGFMFIYSIFLAIFGYILYKAFLFNLDCLKETIYGNMCYDISRLNYYRPIHSYVESIPTVQHISVVYQRLGIIDYNDYIYGISSNTQGLHSILAQAPELQAKTSSIVLGDIVHQNAQLFGDLGEQLLKRLLRYSAPLFISTIVLAGLCVVEHLQPAAIINSVIC